ncbi:TPA: hypothetical protein KN342_003894 [Clostridioides difficile]|nr:hypothetical protein [Clostridioides difficile]HBF2964837.1 hypothetical protein [Clostridioides difficile]HBF4590871.1 hypothetical protein [Clostridioides difficile]HBF4738627.1 hypothetical protein [Clostridioides difficile]HBF5808345.1 hypothetical protein [Clostridioides difficile]
MNDLRGKIIKELNEFNIKADDEFLEYAVEHIEKWMNEGITNEELLIRGVVLAARYVVNMENKGLD